MKKAIWYLLVLSFAMPALANATADDIKLIKAKANLLAKFFSNKTIQNKVTAGGYDYSSLNFIEADDGGSEPVYSILMTGPYDEAKKDFPVKCYYIEFDTDEPADGVRVNETELDQCLN